MTTPAPATNGRYGLGYAARKLPDGRATAGHTGANRGWQAMLDVVPATGDGFVAITNGSNGAHVILQIRCDWIAWQTGTRPPCVTAIAAALIDALAEEGAEAAIARYRHLKQHQPEAYRFGERQLDRLGDVLLERGRLEDAIAILRLNAEEYPASANVAYSLAEMGGGR